MLEVEAVVSAEHTARHSVSMCASLDEVLVGTRGTRTALSSREWSAGGDRVRSGFEADRDLFGRRGIADVSYRLPRD